MNVLERAKDFSHVGCTLAQASRAITFFLSLAAEMVEHNLHQRNMPRLLEVKNINGCLKGSGVDFHEPKLFRGKNKPALNLCYACYTMLRQVTPSSGLPFTNAPEWE